MTANSSTPESLDPDASLPDGEAIEVSSTHCDDGDVDERIARHKKRHCLGTMEIDIDRERRSVELINLDDCIVCETSDNQVSHCSGKDCLLSFHGECLYAELGSSSEHLENPYCPYCWLKLLALKSNSLREMTIGAKNAVCKYLGEEMKSRDEDTTLSGDEDGYNQENSMERATENFQEAEDDNETVKDQNEVSKGVGNKGDVSLFSSMQESSCSGKEQERLIESERNGEDVTEQMTSLAHVTTKVVVANPNTVRVRDIYLFKEQKRKQFWTLEEEEMLKMGVEKFAEEGKKNMPWRKILEMGEKVFHETRTPSNLKDKWRSMVAKESKTAH